jgi:hypothetical protein
MPRTPRGGEILPYWEVKARLNVVEAERPMNQTKDIIQHVEGEDNDFYSDDDLFQISSWGADLSFRELIERYDEGDLVKPELQRKYVWEKTMASRFVESILLGLPVPSVFLAKTDEEKMLIVDGYQRIMTVRDYVKGIFESDGKVFKLTNSEKINERWRRKIRNTTIHAIIFVQKHPSKGDTSLYQVFERINTSGRTLLPQEIRNCVYQGKLNALLFKLNEHANWRTLFGLPHADSRMRDMEFILRFWALSSDGFQQNVTERISLKKYLNDWMAGYRNPEEPDLEELQNRFIRAIDFVAEGFGPGAFQNQSPSNPDKLSGKFSPTIFDSVMVATNAALGEKKFKATAGLESARRLLLRDERYKLAITQETMTVKGIRLRIDRAMEILYNRTFPWPVAV